MKLLKQKLASARAQLTACKPICAMPPAAVLSAARKYRAELLAAGKPNVRNHGADQYLIEVLDDAERYTAYRIEKSRLAGIVASVQEEILAAMSTPSDLE
jgi:hypothetical protein